MKGLIVIPPHIRDPYLPADRFPILFSMMKDKFGFEIQTTQELRFPLDVDVVISYGKFHKKLLKLEPRVKLIVCQVDIHSHSKGSKKTRLKAFDRADILLTPNDEAFREWFPQFIDKSIFFPRFFASHDRFTSFHFNEKPKLKCLLSGVKRKSVYPLRNLVSKREDQSRIDCLKKVRRHRRKKVSAWKYIGKEYARILNRYFCCITCSSVFHYVVGKYLEVPAVGSLLLADECEDSKKMGFVPYKHYIPITESNVFSQIDKCLDNPTEYTEIRRNGMNFVRKNHSVNNRFEQISRILEKLEW